MSEPPPDALQGPTAGPYLDPSIVEDAEKLADVVDWLIHADPDASRRLHEIAAHQDLLRHSIEPDVRQVVLRIDGMVVERWADLAVEIARWAFEAGRRFPLLRGEGSA